MSFENGDRVRVLRPDNRWHPGTLVGEDTSPGKRPGYFVELDDEGFVFCLPIHMQGEAAHQKTHGEFNLAAHTHFVALGAVHTFHEESWEDDGDGESGPHLTGGPAYDQYQFEDEYVFISEYGLADHEPRDLEHEKWCEEQEAKILAEQGELR